MLMVFAKNQTLIDSNGGTTTVFTNAVAVGENNQASAVTIISRIFNAGAGALSWAMQVSNDGVNWVNDGPAATGLNAAATTFNAPVSISAVYARLTISFQSSAGNIGAAVFDVSVNFNRAI